MIQRNSNYTKRKAEFLKITANIDTERGHDFKNIEPRHSNGMACVISAFGFC